MQNNIEEGCLAITFNCRNPDNNGVTVRVGKFIGEVYGWVYTNRWQVDHTFSSIYSDNTTNTMPEDRLMRIDGFAEPVKAVEKEKVYK